MIQIEDNNDKSSIGVRTENVIAALRNGVPISLYIEPASVCNLQCAFCNLQNPKMHRPDHKGKGFMSMDTYNLVINELNGLPFKFRFINFFLHGESLLNKNVYDMVKLAKDANLAERYVITTNGTLLNDVNLTKLLDAGINTIVVSLDSIDREDYKRFKGKDLLPEVLENIDNAINKIPDTVQLKIKCTQGKSITSGNVLSYFKGTPIESSKNIHLTIKDEILWPDEDNKIDDALSPCEFPFYQLVIQYDGSIVPCCVDITNSLIIGRVNGIDGITKALHSDKLKEIRIGLLTGNPPKVCQVCGGRTIVDLKVKKKEILKILS